MDQPQQGDANTNANENNQGQQPLAQPVPIKVNIAGNNTPDTPAEVENNTMPESPAPETANEQMLEQAEAQVAEAEPQSTSDELAAVASELESIVSSGQALDAPQPDSDLSAGSDPMSQVLSQENSNEPIPENSQVAEQPAEPDTPVLDQNSVPEMPESQPEQPEPPVTEPIQIDQNESLATEPAVTEAPAPDAQVPEVTPDINLASLQETADETAPEAPADVVVPTAVAAAVASGSEGHNAITGTPETSSVESSQGAILANQQAEASQQPKQGGGKLKIVLAVLTVTLLFCGGVVAAYMLQPSTDEAETSETTNAATTEETQQVVAEEPTAVTAKSLDDYKVVCASGTVSNATAYAGKAPHQVVVFEKGIDEEYASSLVTFKDKTWSADATKVTSGQLVTCISRKTDSEVKIKSCPITNPTTKVTTNVDFYSTKYEVSVVEASTGKKVTSFENSSTSTTCPTTASYDSADPMIYAGYDQATLEASLKDSITANL